MLLLKSCITGCWSRWTSKRKVVKSSHSSFIIKLGPTNPCRGSAHLSQTVQLEVEPATAGDYDHHRRFKPPQLEV